MQIAMFEQPVLQIADSSVVELPAALRATWRLTMRGVVALAAGLLAFFAVIAAGLLAGHLATERMRREAPAELHQAADYIAATLDRGLVERWRDLKVAADHPVLRDPAAPADAKRAVLSALADTDSNYALLFLITPDGHIEASSRHILEGADVSARAYFRAGRAGPYAGDVHEAILLAGYLGRLPNGEPPRFIDLAVPLTTQDGRPAGVLAAHLFWHWAESVEHGLMEPLRIRRPGTEALILSADGTVLLGPPESRGRKFSQVSEPGRYLMESAATHGAPPLPSLGWSVMVRQDTDMAFARATALQHDIFLSAAGIAAIAALLSGLLAHLITTPMRALTGIAESLAKRTRTAAEAEQALAALGGKATYHEGAALGVALTGLIVSQRRATAALVESETRFRTLAEAVPSLLFETDGQGRTLYVNPGMEAFTGLSAQQIRQGGWLRCVHREDLARTSESWMRAVTAGTAFELECRLRCHDGQTRWVLGRSVPVRDATTRIVCWVGTCTDIDDRKQAEAVLARDKAELAAIVAERTRDLTETQARLAQSQRMEALGQLAGGIAHDFNNVLQAVQGAATLIGDEAGSPGAVRVLARMITSASERGSSVTRRLLAFARKSDLCAEPVAPGPLLAEVREILAHTLGAGITIELAAPEGLPRLLADKAQLETVLVNLATNARDAMPGGGVLTIAAAVESGPPGSTTRGCVSLSVADTGTGMDGETLERASEPFFTTKPSGKGTGLGLSMARGFAEQSGGSFAIESVVGVGTTITLRLPVASDELPNDAAREQARIPMVDKAPTVRATTVRPLEVMTQA